MNNSSFQLHNYTAINKIKVFRFNIPYNYWYKKIQFFYMAFYILGWIGNAKGLVSYMNDLLWKGCRYLSECSYMRVWVYFKPWICTVYIYVWIFIIFVYVACLQHVLYAGPVGKPAVMHLCRVSALSDHLFPPLSHSRLAVLITACFSLFSPSGLS